MIHYFNEGIYLVLHVPSFSKKLLVGSSSVNVAASPQGASSSADFYVVRNGRLSDLEEAVQPGAVYHLEPRLRGGKGGVFQEMHTNMSWLVTGLTGVLLW